MNARTLAGLSLAVLACAAAIPARAADGAPATGSTVTLYTNADLAKFGPPARTTTPRPETERVDDTAAWAFVQAALEREAVRLEAERRHALELEAARAMAGTEGHEACGGGYGYLTAPFVGFGRRRPPSPDFPVIIRDTIHGRPPATQTRHGRYSHLKGADAAPLGYFVDSPASRGRAGRGRSGHR